MNHNLESIFESNWDEIKGNLKLQWSKLTHQDVKQIEGSYDILMGKLKKLYGYTRVEIEEALQAFFQENGIHEIKAKAKNELINWEEKVNSLKEQIRHHAQEYLTVLKEKAACMEECMINYAKENPVKIVTLTALISFAFSKWIGTSKE